MTEEGATTVRLIVQKQNPRARRFWERQGFAVEREMVAKAGKLESPVWLLQRSLEAEAAHAVATEQAGPCRLGACVRHDDEDETRTLQSCPLLV